jgi:hypothetical protein
MIDYLRIYDSSKYLSSEYEPRAMPPLLTLV